MKILSINPGSTSTKFAIFDENLTPILQKSLKHSADEIAMFPTMNKQFEFRKKLILGFIGDCGELSAVIGRGGFLKPLPSGVYQVNEKMKDDLKSQRYGRHASNLGGLIAAEIGAMYNCPAFIADPVVVDEMQAVARISGSPLFPRKSVFHALNQKAMARKFAADSGKAYEDLRLVVAHLGGGVSVGAHVGGCVIDVNQALSGYGAFSPERAGTLPAGDLVQLCFSGKLSKEEIQKLINGGGGMVAHLGTTDVQQAQKRADDGDEQAALVLEALAYNVAKEIGAMLAVLSGECDAVILTGGIAYSEFIVEKIKNRISPLAKIVVYPGEDELLALAQNALRALSGEECGVYE